MAKKAPAPQSPLTAARSAVDAASLRHARRVAGAARYIGDTANTAAKAAAFGALLGARYVSGFAREDQINKNAYGYTLVASGTWNDVYAGVNLSPFAVYKHDFAGNSHQTGNFVEGRMAYTLGLRASYLNSLEAEVQYTEFYGAGENNGARDRDNIGLNVKYAF